ncbi:hypothetical protein [Rhizobium leguminosarum]|uniref:hypothetical protein n=1 Tax=Rhizobium leguminosarum TaxID=384 RepID=UPI0014423BF4|nr:hypothetical protein [Rhizobium leguminosarum]NKJ77781.1 hypothetical protein [Rhizobium leguminosarum bv. viciae]
MMKHRRGIDLVGGSDTGYTVKDGSASSLGSSEHTFRIEVWSDPPDSGGELLETISRATDFAVSMGAYREAVRQRPGKYLVHLNGRFSMSCEKAPDPPLPLSYGRPGGRLGQIQGT